MRPINEIKEDLTDIQKKIKQLESLKVEAEILQDEKARKCCPDVCSSINALVKSLEADIANINEKKNKEMNLAYHASKILKTEEDSNYENLKKQVLRKSERLKLLVNERRSELDKLKETLKTNRICVCK